MQTASATGTPAPADVTTERFPALGLRITTPSAAAAVDLRRDFGAVGDGTRDDAAAFLALADAANTGRVPAGSVVNIPAGTYRVVGDRTVTFRRPIVLRGVGPAATQLRLEYAAIGSVFLRAVGNGQYVMHTTGTYPSRMDRNAYPNTPFARVRGSPRRGDTSVDVDRPDLFAPGDHVYLMCDDYGDPVSYAANNVRSEHYLLKQYLRARVITGVRIHFDAPLRHDFAGAAPRLYRWRPLRAFGIEHLSIDDRSTIADSEATTTFRAVEFDGVVDGWVWDVHFRNSTSIPLSLKRSRFVAVSECLFDRARHVGGGGNGYLPELLLSDDCLVEYSTSIAGRHALICNWSCWGNVLRYNRVVGTPNTETHGEYSVENLYVHNDARASRMEIGGGGDAVHAHDGPFNELRENYAKALRVLKLQDRSNRLIRNWHVDPVTDRGRETEYLGNQRVDTGWDDFQYARFCGHDHTQTAETARP